MGSKFLWIIDNGHAKETPGKCSPELPDGSRLKEYEFNRSIARRLKDKLKAAGVCCHILVPEEDIDIPLAERVRRANELESPIPKLFISVHGNSTGNGTKWDTPRGIQTYYCGGNLKSRRLAMVFQESLVETLGWKDRGVKTAGFYIIKKTKMPSIITENGFYTNQEECRKMLSNTGRDKIAEAHFRAIMEVERKGKAFFL
jgi:N-acetylmuramoyl-L-alanine amidase